MHTTSINKLPPYSHLLAPFHFTLTPEGNVCLSSVALKYKGFAILWAKKVFNEHSEGGEPKTENLHIIKWNHLAEICFSKTTTLRGRVERTRSDVTHLHTVCTAFNSGFGLHSKIQTSTHPKLICMLPRSWCTVYTAPQRPIWDAKRLSSVRKQCGFTIPRLGQKSAALHTNLSGCGAHTNPLRP